MTRLVFRARSNSYPVAVRDGCTNIPLAAGRAQEDETILESGIQAKRRSVRPPGSARTDRVLEDCRIRFDGYDQAAFITAPSMTTPAVTYFQSATSSLRASATIVVFLRRPPLRLTRFSNHRVSADCG